MGLLTITGAKLDTVQFDKSSDADTYTLDVTNAVFAYGPQGGPGVATDVFLTACVDPSTGPLISCIRTTNGHKQMRLRLEGVDAPEWSYVPKLGTYTSHKRFSAEQRERFNLYNENCRQSLAGKAREELKKELKKRFGPVVDVVVRTRVSQPADVFDAYGRFIGGVFAGPAGQEFDFAVWLAENGWAFPAFYEGMEDDEIQRIMDAAAVARPAKNIWSMYGGSAAMFWPNVAYCQPGAEPEQLMLPKLYRRQAVWWAGVHGGLWRDGLCEYLKNCGEKVLLREDHKTWGRAAGQHDLTEFLSNQGTLTRTPEEIVFLDSQSRLFQGTEEVLAWQAPAAQFAWKDKLYRGRDATRIPWVNTVAISADGDRVVSGSFKYDYAVMGRVEGDYCTSCHDGNGNLLWEDKFKGMSGVFAVAISADGKTAASGGWLNMEQALLRVYDVDQQPPGNFLLDVNTIRARVNGVSLSADGKTVAAAADRLYLFRRNGGAYEEIRDPGLMLDGVSAVAVHPDGSWLVACNKRGAVLVAELNVQQNTIKSCHRWNVLYKPTNRVAVHEDLEPVPLICAALARDTNEFAVGGGDVVYVCTRDKMVKMCEWKQAKNRNQLPVPDFPEELDAWCKNSPVGKAGGGAAENVRGLAFSANGMRLAVVTNENISGDKRGRLRLYEGNPRTQRWDVSLPRYPNSVSLDDTGEKIGVAFGFPEKEAGGFSLFDKHGNQTWWFRTSCMNWPVAVSGNGNAMAGGCDDGQTYYFKV